jgi:hypothetical protein
VALSRNLPRKQAFEMLVTGDFISADEGGARAWSTAWCRPPSWTPPVEARLVAASWASRARRWPWARQLFYRQLEVGIEAAYADACRETMACNMMDESALEGVQAFIDKRKPGLDDGARELGDGALADMQLLVGHEGRQEFFRHVGRTRRGGIAQRVVQPLFQARQHRLLRSKVRHLRYRPPGPPAAAPRRDLRHAARAKDAVTCPRRWARHRLRA